MQISWNVFYVKCHFFHADELNNQSDSCRFNWEAQHNAEEWVGMGVVNIKSIKCIFFLQKLVPLCSIV